MADTTALPSEQTIATLASAAIATAYNTGTPGAGAILACPTWNAISGKSAQPTAISPTAPIYHQKACVKYLAARRGTRVRDE